MVSTERIVVPPVVEGTMPVATIKFEEKFFPYDPAEFARWCACDRATIEGVLSVTGDLGKSRGTYFRQAEMGQNYPEARYAQHLIAEKGFRPADIVFEVFYVCASAMRAAQPAAETGYLFNTKVLQRVFSPRFFEAMDKSFALNKTVMGKKSVATMAVDLFAIDEANKRCHFIEVKKYSPGEDKPEPIQEQQLLTLAAVERVAKKLGPAAFVGEPYKVVGEVVVFVPLDAHRTHRFQPKQPGISFTT